MHKIKNFIKVLVKKIIVSFGLNLKEVAFAGHTLTLDMRWRHEINYHRYITSGKAQGALAMDVWSFSYFVKPGQTVLDAGANIGFTSLLAEKAGAAEIHSFEPDPRLIDRLKKNCQGKKITIHSKALGEEPGTLNIFLSTQHNQGSTLNGKMVKKFPKVFSGVKSTEVEVQTLDNIFGNKHFDFFKIDVEGAEIQMLRGAHSIFKNDPPESIFIEIYDDFFDEVNIFLNKFYDYKYRIISDESGNCRLFDLDNNFARLQNDGFYVTPPSYIYSLKSQSELTENWTSPTL